MRKTTILITTLLIILGSATTFFYHYTQQGDINYYRANRLFNAGEYEKAIGYYKKSLDIDPLRMAALRELGYCYLWTEKPDKAINLFQEIAAAHADNYEIKFSLAEAYSWTKHYADAAVLLQEIIAKTGALEAKLKLAEVYLWSGQPETAKPILEEVVKLYPNNPQAKLLWGKALYYTGESEQASEILEGLMGEGEQETP